MRLPTGIVFLAGLSELLALSQSKQPQPTTPASPKKQVAPGKTGGTGTASQGRRYLSGPFEITADRLGPNFWGHDLEAIIDSLEKSDANKPKSEFETTAQYEARQKASRSDGRRFVFVFQEGLGQPEFKYDADSQKMSVSLASSKGLTYYTLLLKSVERTRSRTSIFYTDYGITFENPSGLFTLSSGFTNRPDAQADVLITLELPPDRAREVKPNLRMAVACVLDGVKVYYAYRDSDDIPLPRLLPISTTTVTSYIPVSLEQLLVFDFKTGEVLKRLSTR